MLFNDMFTLSAILHKLLFASRQLETILNSYLDNDTYIDILPHVNWKLICELILISTLTLIFDAVDINSNSSTYLLTYLLTIGVKGEGNLHLSESLERCNHDNSSLSYT